MASISSAQEQLAKNAGVTLDVGASRKHALVLIGPSGAHKSSTGNHLCGEENPGPNVTGDELKAAQAKQIFTNTPLEDTGGKSCTKRCTDHDGRWFYVVDTPGFGDTDAGMDYEKLRENDNLTALRIVKFLNMRGKGITAFVVFLPNPLLKRRDTPTQNLFKHLLQGFDEPQEILDHMIIAQPFAEQADVESQSKARLARQTREIIKGLLEDLVSKLHLPCCVPKELPYACFCPFNDSAAGGSIDKTMQAFEEAIAMLETHIAQRMSDPNPPKETFKPRFPAGKCLHCSYDRGQKAADGLAYVMKPEDRRCHVNVKAFAKWEKFFGGVGKILLLGIPLLVPDIVWPFFTAEDFYCRECGDSCQSPGCSETVGHVFPDPKD